MKWDFFRALKSALLPFCSVKPSKITVFQKKNKKKQKKLSFPEKIFYIYLYDVKNPAHSERPCGAGGACLGFV